MGAEFKQKYSKTFVTTLCTVLYSVGNHPSQKHNISTHQLSVTLPRWALFALWKCCLCTGSGVQRVILPRFPTLLPHESLDWHTGQSSLPFFPIPFFCLWGLTKKPIGYLLLPISTKYSNINFYRIKHTTTLRLGKNNQCVSSSRKTKTSRAKHMYSRPIATN